MNKIVHDYEFCVFYLLYTSRTNQSKIDSARQTQEGRDFQFREILFAQNNTSRSVEVAR